MRMVNKSEIDLWAFANLTRSFSYEVNTPLVYLLNIQSVYNSAVQSPSPSQRCANLKCCTKHSFEHQIDEYLCEELGGSGFEWVERFGQPLEKKDRIKVMAQRKGKTLCMRVLLAVIEIIAIEDFFTLQKFPSRNCTVPFFVHRPNTKFYLHHASIKWYFWNGATYWVMENEKGARERKECLNGKLCVTIPMWVLHFHLIQ